MAKEAMVAKEPAKKTYILRANQEHNGFDENNERKLFVAGDKVQLTDRQYHAFRDKFDSEEELQARARANRGAPTTRAEALEALGLTEEQFNSLPAIAETIKKPNPTPSTGTAEPTPAGTTPAPVGSTPDPVNAPPDEDEDKEEEEKKPVAKPGTAGAAASSKK